jgi:hypothetical protein
METMMKNLGACLVATSLLAAACGSKTLRLDDQPPTGAGGGTGQGSDAGADPTVFIPNQPAVMFVMVDAARAYWATGQTGVDSPPAVFRSCLKDACDATTLTYRTIDGKTPNSINNAPFGGVALDAANVYWVETMVPPRGSAIRACPISGCPTSAPEGLLVAQGASISSLVSDGQFVYWSAAEDTAILRCSIGGCPEGPKAIALVQASAQSLSIDGDYLFWIAKSGEASFDIMRAVKNGGDPPTVLVSGQNRTDSLTARGGWVYWTNAYSVGTVLRCPATGCDNAPSVVADSQHYPHAIAVDDGQAFWTNLEDPTSVPPATLVKCAHGGCGSMPTTIDANLILWGPPDHSIAIDDQYVYWVTMTEKDHNTGSFPFAGVHRAPK